MNLNYNCYNILRTHYTVCDQRAHPISPNSIFLWNRCLKEYMSSDFPQTYRVALHSTTDQYPLNFVVLRNRNDSLSKHSSPIEKTHYGSQHYTLISPFSILTPSFHPTSFQYSKCRSSQPFVPILTAFSFVIRHLQPSPLHTQACYLGTSLIQILTKLKKHRIRILPLLQFSIPPPDLTFALIPTISPVSGAV